LGQDLIWFPYKFPRYGRSSASNGLLTPLPPRFNTWLWIMVVSTFLRPIGSWTNDTP